jgi:hypothetical protein
MPVGEGAKRVAIMALSSWLRRRVLALDLYALFFGLPSL